MKKEKELKYHTFCSVCGFPLNKHQVAAKMEDCFFTSYTDRAQGSLSISLCEECYMRIKTNNIGGMDRALEKIKELKKMDKEDQKRRRAS